MPWGRKTHAVYLNVYDFTNLNKCLNICNLAGFHSGIQVNNLEYCFCVVDSNPLVTGVITIQPQTAQYTLNRKLYLGQTQLTSSQLDQVIDQLSEKYTCGQYHMFNLNCNHFCDELAFRLLGSGIPRWIFNTTNCLRYICCCLPTGLVSGRWAIEALQQQELKQQGGLLKK